MSILLFCVIAVGLVSAAEIDVLLQTKCAACHSGKVKTSGFSVESLATTVAGGTKHGKAVVGGHPELSPLIRMVRGEMAPKMPVGGSLDAREIALLEDWVRSIPAEKQTVQVAWRWPYEKPVKAAASLVFTYRSSVVSVTRRLRRCSGRRRQTP